MKKKIGLFLVFLFLVFFSYRAFSEKPSYFTADDYKKISSYFGDTGCDISKVINFSKEMQAEERFKVNEEGDQGLTIKDVSKLLPSYLCLIYRSTSASFFYEENDPLFLEEIKSKTFPKRDDIKEIYFSLPFTKKIEKCGELFVTALGINFEKVNGKLTRTIIFNPKGSEMYLCNAKAIGLPADLDKNYETKYKKIYEKTSP